MPLLWLFLIVLAIAGAAFVLARMRVMAMSGQDRRSLHSLPNYYGSNAAMKSAIPALLVLVIWLIAQPFYVNSVVSGAIPDSDIAETSSRSLVLAEVRRAADGIDLAIATGNMTEDEARNMRADISDVTQRLSDAGAIVTSQVTQPVLRAAQQFRVLNATGYQIMTAVVLLIAIAGGLWGVRETRPEFRARNVVEQGIRVLLIAAASIAILTTLGIVPARPQRPRLHLLAQSTVPEDSQATIPAITALG